MAKSKKLLRLLHEPEGKLEEMIDDFWDLYYDNWFRDIYFSTIRGVRNLYEWFPIIWNQREWDYHYVYQLLHKKFELIEKHMKSDNCVASVNQDRYIKQVQVLKYLLKRLIDNDYLDNALTRYHERYGDDFSLFDHFEDIDEKPGFKRYIDKTPPNQKKERKRAYKHCDDMEKQDYEYFFKLFKRNLQNFWD